MHNLSWPHLPAIDRLYRIFLVLWAYYKIRHRTKVIAPADADLITGKREIDEEEETYLRREAAKGPQTWKQKLWDSL
jgi:amino acid transporter